jgi:hypothetical protein
MRVNGGRAAAAKVALLALLVAGCGGAGAAGGATGGGGGGSSHARALPCKGSVEAGGGAPSVTLRNTAASREATVPVGALVEIRLDGQHAWNNALVTPKDALLPVGAQGALEHGDCVWDYQVAQVGDAQVMIVGGALCQPDQMCPMYAIVATFTIHGT